MHCGSFYLRDRRDWRRDSVLRMMHGPNSHRMSIELVGIIAIAVGLISIFRKPSFIIYVFVFSTLLGAAAGLILDSLGGASISPAHLLLGFVVYRLMNDREIARGAINSIKPGRPELSGWRSRSSTRF